MKELWVKIWSVLRMRSLRARLFFIMLILAAVPCVLVRFIVVKSYENRAQAQRISVVKEQLYVAAEQLISGNYLSVPEEDAPELDVQRKITDGQLKALADIYAGRVMVIGRDFKVWMDSDRLLTGKTMIDEEVIKAFSGVDTSNYNRELGFIEIAVPIMDEYRQIFGVILTNVSDDTVVSMRDALNKTALTVELILLVIIFAAALFLSRILLRPFENITKAINEMKAGYTNEPMQVPEFTETAHIVDAFNQLQSRMKALDDSREEFVANVSHELKTPMTSIKVLADSLMAQPDAPAELYREFMTDIASEIDRENRVITDLLALVKMDRTNSNLNIGAININELAEMILKRLRPIARKKDIELTLESNRSIVAEVDEVKMTLIMSNLVENAIKYNRDGGWVRVVLDADHQYFTFEVSDSGIGIPEESLAHIYERFYRVDKSHSREIGGTGLGLAITRNAVLMHRGSITVTSTEGEGSVFSVRIPLTFIMPNKG